MAGIIRIAARAGGNLILYSFFSKLLGNNEKKNLHLLSAIVPDFDIETAKQDQLFKKCPFFLSK